MYILATEVAGSRYFFHFEFCSGQLQAHRFILEGLKENATTFNDRHAAEMVAGRIPVNYSAKPELISMTLKKRLIHE